MKFISALSLILHLITVNVVTGIQYGTTVLDIKQYPYYIMIGNPHICGGSLLSYDPPLVLTAAHCIADAPTKPSDYTKDKNPYFVSYYDVRRDKQKSVGIADWIIHPSYNVSSVINANYDVAIVQLDTPLRKSAKVKRVPLWSPLMNTSLPTRGELIGFGYTSLNQPEAKQLQRLQLDITRFNPNGFYNVEARSDTEEHIACHGDSGSPLVVYRTVENPTTKKNVTVPFVVGNLARIFGARDLSPTKLTCPIPLETKDHPFNSSLNTVTESFCNTASMIDWISSATSISVHDLTDPFYSPPHPPCVNCKKNSKSKTSSSSSKGDQNENFDIDEDDDEEDEDEDEDESRKDSEDDDRKNQWHIGVAADENGLLDTNHTNHMWIGGIGHDFLSQMGPDTSNAPSSLSSIQIIHAITVLLLLITTISF